MRCLLCVFQNKNNSEKCHSCDYYLNSKEIRTGISYIEKGFGKINEELDNLEEKVHLVIGLVFKRHKYSAEDLTDSVQMDRIKSIAGKIKDDINNWQRAGKLKGFIKEFYNDYAQATQDRFNAINKNIRERKPTLWEQVGGFFRQLYKSIVELLPVIIQRLITSKKYKHIKETEAA